MNTQHFEGEMPQRTARPLEEMIDAGVERSRLEFCDRLEGPSDMGTLLDRTMHVRRDGETVTQLVARTGISPSQILDWATLRILAHCEQSEKNALELEGEPKSFFAT
jgi:hypothetical protein